MFSGFVYIFCAVISVWASLRFYSAWMQNMYAPYWDFCAFFAVLAASFVAPVLFFTVPRLGSFAGELITFFILLSFAFVLRAFVRFQGFVRFSPNSITSVVGAAAFFKFLWSFILVPSVPVLADGIVYWHYPTLNAMVYGALLLLFTVAMGATLLSNLGNIRAHKRPIFLLGIAFLVGGLSGIFIVNFNTFAPVFIGYTLLLITFILVFLFAFTLSKENTRQ